MIDEDSRGVRGPSGADGDRAARDVLVPALRVVAPDESSLLVAEGGGPRLFDVADIAPEARPEIETGLALLETLKNVPEPLEWFYVSPPASFGVWAPAPTNGSYRLSDDILLTDAEGVFTISSADLAIAIHDEIEAPQHHRRRFHAAH